MDANATGREANPPVPDSLTILQLSDLHIFAVASERLANVPTTRTFAEVLAFIDANEPFDYLVLTGDLAQDEALPTYEKLREMLGSRMDRTWLVPGNHDDREHLRRVFADRAPAAGPLTFAFDAGKWRVLGLDTHVPGQVSGRLDPEQLGWLDAELAGEPARPCLVFCHHPPVPCGVDWLDRLSLEEPYPLLARMRDHERFRALACGHVHRESESTVGGTHVYTTPSTAFQFGDARDTRYDLLPPGYRRFTLRGDELASEVVRLPELRFPPSRD